MLPRKNNIHWGIGVCTSKGNIVGRTITAYIIYKQKTSEIHTWETSMLDKKN